MPPYRQVELREVQTRKMDALKQVRRCLLAASFLCWQGLSILLRFSHANFKEEQRL